MSRTRNKPILTPGARKYILGHLPADGASMFLHALYRGHCSDVLLACADRQLLAHIGKLGGDS